MPVKNQPAARGSTHRNTAMQINAVSRSFIASPITAACKKAALSVPILRPAKAAKNRAGTNAARLPNNEEYTAIDPTGINMIANTIAASDCVLNHLPICGLIAPAPSPAPFVSARFSWACRAAIRTASFLGANIFDRTIFSAHLPICNAPPKTGHINILPITWATRRDVIRDT